MTQRDEASASSLRCDVPFSLDSELNSDFVVSLVASELFETILRRRLAAKCEKSKRSRAGARVNGASQLAYVAWPRICAAAACIRCARGL